MAKKQQTRLLLTDSKVKEAKPGDGVVRIWDTVVAGFHLRITPAGTKSFCVAFQRTDGKKVNVTLGSAEAWPVEDPKPVKGGQPLLDANGEPRIGARTWARLLRKQHEHGQDIRVAVKVVRSGKDLRALVKVWREDYRPSLKPTTQISYDSLLKDKGEGRDKAKVGPILSVLGSRLVKDLTYEDVKDLHRNVRKGGHVTNANRAVAVLSRLMDIAEKEGWRPKGSNPCTGFEKPTERPRSRLLSPSELTALGRALCLMEAADVAMKEKADGVPNPKGRRVIRRVKPQVTDLVRFLALSGLRKSEALSLKFQDVDLDRSIMRFHEHKTSEQSGTKVLPLNLHLKEIVQRRAQERLGPYVFSGWKAGRHIVGFAKMWQRVVAVAELDNVSPHDLRRTFMSVSMELGYPAAIGDALLGHSLGKIRDTYIRLGSEGIMATASQEVADWIAAAMAGEAVKPGVKVKAGASS